MIVVNFFNQQRGESPRIFFEISSRLFHDLKQCAHIFAVDKVIV